MILVDKDIIDRSKEIFINGYDEENVKPISYDIHIAEVITEHGNVDELFETIGMSDEQIANRIKNL